MKRTWVVLPAAVAIVAGVLLAVMVSREPVEEGWCTLRYHKGPTPDDSIMTTMAMRLLTPLPDKPGHIRDLPPGAEQARFYQLECGGGSSVVLCLLPGRRLYVDTDGDGVLSNERCLRGAARGKSEYRWEYGPVRLKNAGAGSGTTARFRVRSYREDVPSPVCVYPDGYQTGRLRIDGRVYRVAAVDGDYDGRFRTTLSLPVPSRWDTRSDLMAIDRDGDGEFRYAGRRCDIAPLGRMVIMHDKYYAIDLADDGSRLELRAAQPAMGELVIDCTQAEFECELLSDAAEQSLYFTYESKGRSLPVGTYGVIEAALRALNAEGRQLLFQCSRPTSSLSCFEIKAGEVTTLKIGQPFVVAAQVRPAGDQVSIQPILRDCAGDEYTPTGGGLRSSSQPPSFYILDEQDNCLHSGQFAYG